MSNMPAPMQPLPYWYQRDDLTYIFNQLRAGEFCSLIGMGSAGKSNLVSLVAREDVRPHYIQPSEEAMTYVVVMLNPHLLISLSEDAMYHTGQAWSGYELMISRLRRKLISPPFTPWLRDSGYGHVIDLIEQTYYMSLFDKLPAFAQTGIRQLEGAVYEVLSLGEAWRVAFIFDEFEQFIEQLPPHFFQSLRGLRDEYKGRIMYVTTSRRPLWELTQEKYPEEKERLVMEGFVELFHGGTRYVSPLDFDSALFSVERLEKRYKAPLQDMTRRNLIAVTGGHAGLLRRGFVPTKDNPQAGGDGMALIKVMLSHKGVSDECSVLIRSLSADERRVLKQMLLNEAIVDRGALQSLIDKHIVYLDGGQPYWRMPLLAGWAQEHKAEL